MPCYPFQCPKCESYEEVWSTMSNMPKTRKCPECGTKMGRVYDGGTQINMQKAYHWENENGGAGREIESLKAKHFHKAPTFRNRKSLIEHYKRAEVEFDVC